MIRIFATTVFALLVSVSVAVSVEPDEVLDDPVLEQRARALSAELRCLVCQNQSIDDSDAPLAKDLRILVRERLVAGDSDPQIRAYLVDRYGTFVLLKPPFSTATLLLWTTPVLVLLIGGIWFFRRNRNQVTDRLALSDEEEQALEDLLERYEAEQQGKPPNPN